MIPAGEFLMGSDPNVDKMAQGEEQPQHRLYLPDYYMAKTPVTNAQYATFAQATGHRQPGHWKKGQPPAEKLDHPVVNVTWRDAVAYCNWLAKATGKPYRLPTEAEWEKAARGNDGRIYPWGNEWDEKRCNTHEGGLFDTTSVSIYPDGKNPYGLLDMAGNVWEWTISLWGDDFEKPNFKYPYDPTDGRENMEAGDDLLCVLRGGSFLYLQDSARCAFRYRYFPDCRIYYLGFRVVVRY